MAAHWWWTWSIGLPTQAYADSQWGVSSLANVVTNSTTNLFSPGGGSLAPGNEFNCQIAGTANVQTPAFPGGALSVGWAIAHWNADTGLTLSAAVSILQLFSGSTARVRVFPTATAATSTLSLSVNGTLVGTTTGVYGDASEVLAVDFDLTATPPQAGLVVSGIREIARAGGSGTPTTIDRLYLSSGSGASTSWFGDLAVYGALADLTDSETQDVWVTWLSTNAVTDADASWTPSTGTDVSVLADGLSSTWTQSVTNPDSVLVGFESTTDRLASWAPTVIYGVAGVAYGTGSVITATTLTLADPGGSFAPVNDTLNAIGRFIGSWHALDAVGVPWTAFTVNGTELTYAVST